jgi:glycosyltransferase 2 family protein
LKLSRVVQWLLGTCLAAAGLLIFFRSVDPHRLVLQLSHASPWGIAACAGLAVMSIWLRAIRWKVMLPEPPLSHKKQLFPLVMIAFMINNILPARMGEAARAVLLWRRNKYSAAVSIGSLILERGIDVLALSACFFAPVFLLPGMGSGDRSSVYTAVTLHTAAILLAALVACCIGLIAAYSVFPTAVGRMFGRALTIVPESIRPRIERVGRDVASTLDWLFSWKKVVAVVALSAGIVACYGFSILALMQGEHFGLLQALFAQAFAALGAAIPLAPGYVGTLHAFMLEGLALCSVGRDKAQAITILYHAVPYITITALGLYYFFKLNVTFKDISEAEKKIEKEDQGAHE